MPRQTIPLTFEMQLEVPRVPNFIMRPGGPEAGKVALSELSEESLRYIGNAWTDELVARAAEQRGQNAERASHA